MFLSELELPALIIVTLVTLFLGGIVFYRNRRSHSNILFVLLSLSFGIWAVVNYFSLHPPFGHDLFWIRLVLLSAAPQAFLFAFFMHTFPGGKIRMRKRYLAPMSLLLSVQMYLTITPLVFKDIRGGVPEPGVLMPFFAFVLVLFFCAGIYLLFWHFIRSKGEERKAAGIIIVGFTVMVILLLSFLLFAVVVLKNTTFIPLSPVFILPFLIATGYALTRQKFLNIKLIATEFFVGILTILLLTEALLSTSWFTILSKSLFAFFVTFLGVLLIKSVHREIAQKEKLAELAKSLENANLRLRELDRQKTEFLSIASHQLRTPMSIIKGYIELIQDGAYGKISKKTFGVLSDMDETNERLVKLIDEFLDISRIEQGRTKFSFENHDIKNMISSVVKELTQRATDKGLSLVWKPGKGKANIVMDEEKVRHIVFNFIDNAIKYSEKGKITVSLSKEKGGYSVIVKDEGIGFDKVDEANFFQKFYRGKNVKGTNVGGTGLGIYVTKQFAEKHGGRVWAHSEGLGKGGEFGVWLPLNANKAGTVSADGKRGEKELKEQNKKDKK